MRQTAIEWLEENLLFEPWAEEHFEHNYECWDKAKEMEKEQIIDARINGDMNGMCIAKLAKEKAEKYYNKTFKSE